MPLIPFATKSAGNLTYSGERLVNWFARATEGLSAASLIGRSGAVVQADLGGPVRAVFGFNGSTFAVANGNLVKVVGATVTVIGAVGTSEHVSVASNNTQIALIVGTTYFVSDGATVASYGTGAISTPVWLTAMDGYIIMVGEGQGRPDLITVSGLDDATAFSALDFASAESAPDGLVATISDHGEAWMFGETSIEVWYNSGDADFPFARNTGAKVERGLHKASTIAKEDNAVFFVGNDLVVYRATGVAPAVISTREIEEKLRADTIHSAITFEERGHKFYAIRMTSSPTLVFDMTTNLWHERTTGTEDQPWFIVCGARIGSAQYYGTDTGKLVTLDENTLTDAGATILAEAVSVPIYNADFFSVGRIHMQMSGGTGTSDILQSRDARVSLEMSKDGRNWDNERWRDIGNIGEYGKVIEWHGMGAFRRAQIRVRVSDPVKRDLHGIQYDVA